MNTRPRAGLCRPSRATRLVALLSLCATCAPAPPGPDWLPEAGTPRLSYRVVLDELGLRASARVEMVVRAEPGRTLPSPLRLTVPDQWAGRRDLGDDLVDLRAEDARGRLALVDREPGRAEVRHEGADALRIVYRVRPRARELGETSRFAAVGTPDVLLVYGRDLFLRPEDGAEQEGPVSLALEVERPDAVWVTTLGAAGVSIQVREVSLAPLLDAAFMGGRPRVTPGPTDARLLVAADPALGLVDDGIAAAAERVVAYQTMAFGPPSRATTTGLLARRSDDPDAATGTGRPGGFVLELGDAREPGDPEVAELLAHENLHRYLGFDVAFDGPTALETLWLKEGVVSYLAALTVVHSGLAPPDAYLDALSRALTGYLSNEAQRLAVTDVEEGFWWDDGLRRRPYERGFMLAFWLDQRLRRAGDRLERAVAALIEASRGGPPLTLDDVAAFFALRAHDPELPARLRGWVLDGTPLPWSDWLADAGLRWREEREPVAYLGVEAQRERGGSWRVTAIDPGGPAASSWLRVGDRLEAFPDLDRLPPTRSARLDVVRDGAVHALTVRPMAGERPRWVVEDDGAFGLAMGWHH